MFPQCVCEGVSFAGIRRGGQARRACLVVHPGREGGGDDPDNGGWGRCRCEERGWRTAARVVSHSHTVVIIEYKRLIRGLLYILIN